MKVLTSVLTLALLIASTEVSADLGECENKLEEWGTLIQSTEVEDEFACGEDEACSKSRCRFWMNTRAKITAVTGQDNNCSRLAALRFSDFLTKAKNYTSNCTPTPVPQAPLDCEDGKKITLVTMEKLMVHEPIDTCLDCTGLCSDFRTYETHLNGLSAECKTQVEERVATRLPELSGLLGQIDTGCAGKGL